MEMIDCVGVQEFFATHTASIEDIGCGLVRITRCICRGGVLVPVFTVVSPAANVLQDAHRFRDVVYQVACRNGSGSDQPH